MLTEPIRRRRPASLDPARACTSIMRTVSELLPELYLHGMAEGDFDLALRGLLGEEAPLSARTVARLKERWQGA